MCGISGFFHFEQDRLANGSLLKKMNDTLSHRGPDGEGFYCRKNVALGHRRLAIIDLSTGEQPMYSEDGSIALIFNGEIYNYVELKEELTGLGKKFTTTSDTEVIIQAYRTWGVDCQKRFNGMWAFALWDENLQRMFLSRDRIGEKPLYYSLTDRSLVFGSEIKAILAYGVPARPRTELTELYLNLSFIPAPYTFYKDVQQMMPGNYLLVDRNGAKELNYWSLPDLTEKDMTRDKTRVETAFAELFDDSVKIRMRSDVAFGAFLSGGLDSSCVVSAMAHHTSKPVQTFTMGFDNKQYDERHLARMVHEKFSTDHHEGVLTAEHFDEALEKVLYQYDDPFGDASAIPTGQVSHYASQFVKMVLTGDGGDEVLSGYTIYQGEKFARQYQRLPAPLRHLFPWAARTAAIPFRGGLRYKLNRVAKVLESSNQPFETRLQQKLCFTSPEKLAGIVAPGKASITFLDFYHEAMKKCRFTDPFYKLMYFHHSVTLPGDMLTKVDRMSMAYSIETRVPFLDHRIIELLFGVHKQLKLKGYLNKTILRNAVANKALPAPLLTASKKGFSVPLRDWFREDGLNNKIKDLLLENNDQSAYVSKAVEKLIDDNTSARSDVGNFIWMVIVLRKWFDAQNQKAQPERSTLTRIAS